jgi:CBS-domain-containing membrane protein
MQLRSRTKSARIEGASEALLKGEGLIQPKRQRKTRKRDVAAAAKGRVKKALSETDSEDLLAYMKTTLVSVNVSDPLLTVLSVLNDNKVSCAAVYDPKAKRHVGFVDAVDIITISMKLLEAAGETLSGSPKDQRESDESVPAEGRRLREEILIADLKARTVADFSGRDPFVTLNCKKSALMAAQLLSKPDVHRIGLVDASGKLLGVVTQSQLAQHIFEEHTELLQKLRVRLSTLQLPTAVAKIRDSEPAIVAFQHMVETRVSGLAVVDAAGLLVDVISKSDFTLWNEWIAGGVPLRFFSVEKLHEPVRQYLQAVRAQLALPKPQRVISCSMDDTIEKALELLIEHNVHRVFIVDALGAPVSVVTYCEALAVFAS